MNKTHSPVLPSEYRSIKAYIILKCTAGFDTIIPGGLPKSLTVISLRGTFVLDFIEEPLRVHSDDTTDNEEDTSTGSATNLSLAKQWLQNCIHNHDLCTEVIAQQQNKFHPRRLINLEDPKKPFLQVMSGSTVPYVALSYAWGEGYRFLTFKKDYDQFQTCLPVEKFPRTFKGAMRVAELIGVTHIWIDAICIIQDEPSDLEAELPIMGDIYRHAVFTIYAEGSSSTQSGLFRNRNPKAYQPCTIDVTGLAPDPGTETTLTLATRLTGPDYLKERSWCLQEEVLTSRFLRFGTQMSWRCITSTASETHPAPRPRKSPLSDVLASDIDRLRMWLYAPADMANSPRQSWFRRNHFDAWYDVVEEYSRRQLRAVSDNIKALSGLAAMFTRAHRSRYVAGLWAEDLQLGLAWYVALNDTRPIVKVEGTPSWSWAAVGKVRLKFRAWESHSTHLCEEGMDVLETSCDMFSPVNPYGAVKLGSVKLRARLWKGLLVHNKEYAEYRTRPVPRPGATKFPGFEGEDKMEHPRYPALILEQSTLKPLMEAALDFNPAGDSELEAGREVWCLLLHVQKSREVRRYTFLILEQLQGNGTKELEYRRIGLGWGTESSQTLGMHLFANNDKEEVTII
ncbi:HET-domain-containing protein [Coniochaeta sp. PMI_546]|nr:HET-domain-containing protein [Coniochaeta sp. PMI_546]